MPGPTTGGKLSCACLISFDQCDTHPNVGQIVNMAKMTWGFDISPGSPAVDVSIKTAYSDGFLTSPKRFSLQFAPRSRKHEEVIAGEFEAATAVFTQYED